MGAMATPGSSTLVLVVVIDGVKEGSGSTVRTV